MRVLANATAEKLLILLNFPHNPTGYAVSRVEAQQIVDTIAAQAEAGCHILVMIDDAYAGLWYNAGVMHESLFGLVGWMPPECGASEDRWCHERGVRMGVTCGVYDLRT